MNDKNMRIAVIGGAGRVGLSLSLSMARNNFEVVAIDIDKAKVEMLKDGKLPFMEEGGLELLKQINEEMLSFCTEHNNVAKCDVIILTVGTPVDEHLNPNLTHVYEAIDQIKPFLRDGQVIILRSTLFPGTSEKIYESLKSAGLNVGVSFCPERIAQGKALKEIRDFPQIISGSDPESLDVARHIFSTIACEVIELKMTEAELAKLYTNAWRYIKFAVSNQFYMIAVEKGLDFHKIHKAITSNYPRAKDLPVAGFAAGPCLFKDTMQLAAYNRQHFPLGHAAMQINESLPNFLIDCVKRNQSLKGTFVGILGMAFKGDSDDNRESLSYKLRKLLQYEGATVMCTDPYIKAGDFFPLETVLKDCELLFIGCPHSVYRQIDFEGLDVIDCWSFVKGKEEND